MGFARALPSARDLGPAGRDLQRSWGFAALVFAYWLLLALLGDLRMDHLLACGFALFLYYWSLGSRRFLFFLAPLILSGIVYDSMRYFGHHLRSTVHVAEPYLAEKFLFGMPTGPNGTVETPNEFLQRHTHAVFDFLCGLAYLVFIFEYIFFCFYFFFAGHWGELRRAAWSFFWVNCLGYATYHLYAAAPPWYVALYGLGPAKLDTPANPAGAARFDALLDTDVFANMYAKSVDVFGAIPSLHVSYPFLALVFALRIGRFRAFSAFFFALMCFSAVYLNHHYVIDVLLGIAYAAVTFWLVALFYRTRAIDPDRIY